MKNTGQTALISGHPLKVIIRGGLKRIVLCSLAFALAHLLGMRAYTSLLSGTASFGILQRLFGTTYLVLYVGFVFLVPILLIAVGLLEAVVLTGGLWRSAKNAKDHDTTDSG